VLGLGANVGARAGYLQAARQRLSRHPAIRLIAASPIYETPPLEVEGPQREYLNQVVIITTDLPPAGLHEATREIEAELGRPVDHAPQEPRTIDIDMIAYGARVLAGPGLVAPHPSYTRRRFVLVPLCDVRPGYADPVTGVGIRDLLAACPDASEIRPWSSKMAAAC